MGAIAGGIDLRGEGRVDRVALERMAAALRSVHAGSAGEPAIHHASDGGVVAVPDASPSGARLAGHDATPTACYATNADGNLHIVFDGAISNREALEQELAQAPLVGTRSNGTNATATATPASDASLVLRLYQADRQGSVAKLRGSFVFAVFEPARRRMFVARDAMGSRHLRFFEQGGLVLFATETRALTTHDDVACRFDLPALSHYLTFGYMPAPFTGISFVSRVPPGHSLVVDRGNANLIRYFRPRIEPDDDLTKPLQLGLLGTEVKRVVKDAFERMPDAGLLLDGSLASATLAWATHTATDHKPTVFEVVPEGETPTAVSTLAKHFGFGYRGIAIPSPTPESLEAYARVLEEPIADPAALAVFEGLKRLAGETERLILPTGLDSLIGAEQRYHRFVRETGPAFMPRDFFRTLARWWPARLPGGDTMRLYAQRPSTRFLMRDVIFHEEHKRELLGGAGAAMLAGQPSLSLFRYWFRGTSDLPRPERYRLADLISRLPDSVLTRYDHAARANGIQVLYPFLDADFVRKLGTLPPGAKRAPRSADSILSTLCADELPEGFAATHAPRAGAWLSPPLKDFTHRILGDPRIAERGLLRTGGLGQVLNERGRRGALRRHTLLMLELWRRSLEERSPRESPPRIGTGA